MTIRATARRLSLVLCVLCPAGRAWSATLKIASTGGLMQQPTSHYYHAVYGGYVEGATESQSVIGRVQYVERPEFSNVGFADKDYGAFAMVGTKLTKAKEQGLAAFFGFGRMSGYVRAEGESKEQVEVDERAYSLPGPTTAVEYAWRWRRLDVAVNHQTFIGYVDKTQTDAYVAWPYNFFQATIGVVW